jgi:K+-transporting ATPase c subunit
MTRFTLFHGVAFANEAGLIGVVCAPRLANGVATQTAHVVVGSELVIQVFHLFANATKFHHLAYVVVGYAII